MRVLQAGPACSECGFVPRVEFLDLSEWLRDSEEAERQDEAYRKHIRHETRDLLSKTPVAELVRRYDVSPIRRQFGSWAVTTYGLECLTDCYAIEKSRLYESDWEHHMSEKTWVLMDDFTAAYRAARTTYRIPVSPRVRFMILQRDGFRCQLCGHGADDGSVLEIDHKVPVARGGSNKVANLWTLCWDCNRGKSAQLLEPPS